MDKRIHDILTDLYRIEPDMKAHEKELSSLVSKLVDLKPDTHFDESFAARLRSELLEIKTRPISSPYASIFVSRAFYGILSSALTILIAVPLTFIATQKATSPEKPVVFNPFATQEVKDSFGLTQKQQISNKGINAFGKLALIPTVSTDAEITSRASTADAPPTSAESSVQTLGAVSQVDSKNQKYSYVYTGEELKLPESEGRIFKRTKGIESGKQLADLIQSSRFNLSDLTTFGDLALRNVEMSENKPFGYTISVNFDQGAISINPQTEYWNNTSTAPVSQIDSYAVIAIANQFAKDHSIDMNIYGKPVVVNVSETRGQATVVFPLIIDSKPVYDSNGAPFGLVVIVDLRQTKVASVNNLTSQIYDSSSYKLESDFAAIVHVATSTLAGSGHGVTSGKEARLGTPTKVLMRYWFYDEKTQTNNELYIPALSFPITYSDGNTTLPTTVLVPLVKDFLSKQNAIGSSTSQGPLS